MALAGPRCLDLRSSAAERLGIGELLMVGDRRERWRLLLGSVNAILPLRGWFLLEWGPTTAAARMTAPERLACLARNRSMLVQPQNPALLLDLATLPAWRLARPPTWDSLPAAGKLLLETITTS